ncbi:uncharacterized protein [Diadema antillarum]|uniref:uncharacterized protein n=1 Tax=Diadema antillarum TaxID=105358 RepID=UPI003A86BE94
MNASLWDNGEPNNNVNQDCAALISTRLSATNSPSHGQWDDHNCDVQRGYICERPVEHPQLSSPPLALEIGSHFARVRWRAWEESLDIGDGPIIGYVVHVGFTAAHVSRSVHSNSSEDFETVIRGLQPGKEYHISVSVARNSSNGPVDELTGPSIIINSPLYATDAPSESLDMVESHQEKSVAAWALFATSITINFFLIIVIIYLCKVMRMKAKKQSTKVELSLHANKSAPHLYQDLTLPPGSSGTPNPVYQDIAAVKEEEGNSGQATYVNTACGSTPKKAALYEIPDCCRQSIPDDGRKTAPK